MDFSSVFQEAYTSLNAKQQEAVNAIEGPVLVIAGPGTGKTQILAVRTGKILKETDVMPENILCLTYTDAGTVAMRKRLLQFIGPDAYRVNIYTFHAFCNDVIQANLDYFGKRELEPISELENVNLIETILTELPADHILKKLKGELDYEVGRLNNLFRMMKEEDWTVEKIKSAIQNYLIDIPTREEFIYKRANAAKGIKVGDLKQKDIDAEIEKMDKLSAAAELFTVYQNKMLAMGRYDYSDMILWVVKAFTENENILRNYQERYLYFLVDEFQDTNGSQNEILKLLINFWDVPNVFTVGDDDQSIYEFQGARVKNILDFYAAYENAISVVVLTENYRSNQPILDAAKFLIEHNAERLINKIEGLNKNLSAAKQELIARPIEPAVLEFPNILQEEAGIMQRIEQLHAAGIPLREIAVIYHRHAQAERLLDIFEKRKLPYAVKRKINILELHFVQQLLNVLRYLEEERKKPHSGEFYLFEIMHYHFSGINTHDIASLSAWISSKRDGKYTWREVISANEHLNQIKLKDPEAILRFEKNLVEWLQETHNLTLQILFEKIMHQSGLLNFILNHDERNWLLEVVTTLFNFIRSEGERNPRMSITQFLDTIRQMEIHGIGLPLNKTIENANGVNFITAHSAKGLEFEYVFLLGCTSDKWESARTGNFGFSLPDTLTFTNAENRIESLRRLFYVAMTRAKQHLFISYAAFNNEGKELEPSQFISEMQLGGNSITQKETVSEEALIAFKIAELSPAEPVAIDLFDKDFIRSKVENFVMSASNLNAYLDCPIKFYFEKIIRIPVAKNDSMAFGSAIHYALRRLYERMKESERKLFPTLEVLLNDFNYEMHRNEDSFTQKQFQNRIDLGKQLLAEYYSHYVNSWNKIVVTEYPLRNIHLGEVPLTGVFDKIEFDGRNVNVVDYKTGSVKYAADKLKAPDEKNPDGGDYWRQIMFYKILLDAQRVKPWTMISGEIDFLEKDERKNDFVKVKYEMIPDQIEIVKTQIRHVYQKIMNLEFTQGCGKEDCEWCNFVRENYILKEHAITL